MIESTVAEKSINLVEICPKISHTHTLQERGFDRYEKRYVSYIFIHHFVNLLRINRLFFKSSISKMCHAFGPGFSLQVRSTCQDARHRATALSSHRRSWTPGFPLKVSLFHLPFYLLRQDLFHQGLLVSLLSRQAREEKQEARIRFGFDQTWCK